MQAVVFHDVGDIRVERVDDPQLQQPLDAIVRLTASAICGTDLHMIRGTLPGMRPGTILGHEGVGIVEAVGTHVRNLRPGDRVVIPSTIACGYCSYCRDGYQAQCDNANPNGPQAGTAFYGGPESTGAFAGLQAEYARVPYANANLVKLPEQVSDDQAILLSDIFPTGAFGAELAEIGPGDTALVLGCGPVGQFAITSAMLRGADRVLAVDCQPDRLEMARAQGAEVIDFSREDPVAVVRDLTGGIGVDRCIDAVGVDAVRPSDGPAAAREGSAQTPSQAAAERDAVVGQTNPDGRNWQPGDAPSQALDWAVAMTAKAGSIGIIGVYPPTQRSFPIGQAMNRNLTVKLGNCNHRRYLPQLIEAVRSGRVDPLHVLTRREPMHAVIDAYRAFDTRTPGWIKVELELAPGAQRGGR